MSHRTLPGDLMGGDRIRMEHKPSRIFHAVENVPRAAVEVIRAVDAERLVPLDPRAAD